MAGACPVVVVVWLAWLPALARAAVLVRAGAARERHRPTWRSAIAPTRAGRGLLLRGWPESAGRELGKAQIGLESGIRSEIFRQKPPIPVRRETEISVKFKLLVKV
jgi:hypothetical protein